MDRVTHFKIPVDNKKRAKNFYGSVFGRGIVDYPTNGEAYPRAATVSGYDDNIPEEPGAVNRGSGEVKHPLISIDVESINDTLKKIESSGGRTILAKIRVDNMGYYASFRDPEGNVVGLWEDRK